MDHYPTPPDFHYNYSLVELNFLLDLIFPRSCVGCGKTGKYFCDFCIKTIRFYSEKINSTYHCPKYLDGIFVLAHYDGLIRKAIKEVKYRGKYAIFSEIAQMFPARIATQSVAGGDFLVPVPLSKERELIRGFNQAEKLAKYLKLAPILNCLVRTRNTKPQFDLKLHEREENVKNAFAFNSKFPVHSSQLCLVDDVATTGSTLSECAKILKKAGAAKVFAIVIARGN